MPKNVTKKESRPSKKGPPGKTLPGRICTCSRARIHGWSERRTTAEPSRSTPLNRKPSRPVGNWLKAAPLYSSSTGVMGASAPGTVIIPSRCLRRRLGRFCIRQHRRIAATGRLLEGRSAMWCASPVVRTSTVQGSE